MLFLAYTGVRFGEMAALRVRRLDLLRRRATIAESVTLVRGERVWGTPKGHERRAVPIPRFLINELAQHVACKGPEDLVFPGVRGGPLRAQSFQRTVLTDAATATGLPGFHPTCCATPPRAWPSRPAPTSRSCSRCSATRPPR